MSHALRQISPEEVSMQGDVASHFSSQQIANVSSRLSAVRRGMGKMPFSNLTISYDGKSLPLAYMLNNFFNNNDDGTTEQGSLLDNRVGAFANGSISYGSRTDSSRESGFDFDSYGLTLGADYRLTRQRFLGAALGLSKSSVQVSNNGGDMDSSGFSLNLYMNQYINDNWYK